MDRIKLVKDLNSPSASNRNRALNALKTPNKHKRYSMFDVAYEEEEIVTSAERLSIQNIKPKTIQDVFQKTRVYVEVRSGDDDLTQGIQSVLRQLGAHISNTLGKTTTHVVFKDGLNSTYTKAKKMEIPVVSVLWIEACRKMLILADPTKYPISNLERYENPELFKRVRRPKVMTPKLNMTQPSRYSLSSYGTANNSKLVTTTKEEQKRETQSSSLIKVEMKAEINVINNKASDKTDHTSGLLIRTPNRRQTIHIATPRPTSKTEEISANVTLKAASNIWMKAVDNIHRVAELSRSIKVEGELPKPNLPNPFSPDFHTPKVVNKRRTLYTPEPFFEPFNTPKTLGTKPINKRRTLFTPDSVQPVHTVAKSATRRRTLLPAIPSDKTVEPHKPPHTVSKVLTSSKRKLEEKSKENTPPHRKPFLTPSGKLLLIQKVANTKDDSVTTPVGQSNKRRRTLYMTPEFKIKC